MYRLRTSVRANRDLRALAERAQRHDVGRLYIAIESLPNEPRPYGVQKIRGKDNAYRIRVGNFRVIYEIYDKENAVLISRVLRRTETTYRA